MAKQDQQTGVISIYDVASDEFRPITLEDVNMLERGVQAFGAVMTALPVLREHALAMGQGKIHIQSLADGITKEVQRTENWWASSPSPLVKEVG